MSLLNVDLITAAMNLNESDIERALGRSGYQDPDELLTALCRGMTVHGTFVYDITYTDLNTGNPANGCVYVRYTDNRVLTADY